MKIKVEIILELDDKQVATTGTKDVHIILNTLGTLLENATDDWWTYGPCVTSKVINTKKEG